MKIFTVLLGSFLFIQHISGQTCLSGGTPIGPCGAGNTCQAGFTCDVPNNQCCPSAVTTTTAPCVDLLNPKNGVSDCPADAYLCNNSLYYNLMTQQCPKTCNRCSGSSGNCVDLLNPQTGVSDCPSRAYLCNNSLYYSLMTQQCPKTCNRCSSG